MGKIWSLTRRELAGYFYSPLAYFAGSLFLLACGFIFIPPPMAWADSWGLFILVPMRQASMGPLFEMMGMAMIVAAPLLTMRSFSEEFRSGTIEVLMTAPVTDTQVVLGKFFGAILLLLTLLSTTLLFLLLMFLYAQPDVGVVCMGYLGIILLGTMFISVGIFTSTFSQHQFIAVLSSIVILVILGALLQYGQSLGEPFRTLSMHLDAKEHLSKFARGTFDSRGLIYFLSLTVGFLFFSVKSLESRRWR